MDPDSSATSGTAHHLQYAVKSNVIVLVTLADLVLNSLCDFSDRPSLPQWFPAVILG